MKIYIAGASAEPERVQRAMDAARQLGYEVTLDWLAVIKAVGAANDGLSVGERQKYALADLGAIYRADVFWLLAPENASTGAWVELGYAIAVEARLENVVVSGPGAAKCIFVELADVVAPTDELALQHLKQLLTQVAFRQ